eukprot:g9520.t1
MTAAMGPFQRNQELLSNNDPDEQHRLYDDRRQQQQHQQHQQHQHQHQHQEQHDGSVIFTHLFSAPLVERKMATGGSGCVLVEKVDELSYQKERDTLHSTLDIAGKRVRFLSEAANAASFARAVGCRAPYPSSQPATRRGLGGGGAEAGAGAGGGSCRDGECRIVHFTGHGVEGQLTFEDDCGRLQYVDEEELLKMLSCGRARSSGGSATVLPAAAAAAAAAPDGGGFGGGIGYAPFVDESAEPEFRLEDLGLGVGGGGQAGRGGGGCGGAGGVDAAAVPRTGLQLVFLSSCHSQSVAKCFIEAGVAHVIAVKQEFKVLDHKAAEFAKMFYTSLLRGDTVRQAFHLGSAQLGVSDQPEEGHKFLLLPPDGNHDVPVFEEVPAGQFVDATPVKPPYRCDAVANYFWGRAVDVQKVVKHMVRGAPCVTITGQAGIGKTQVLLKACAYTRERNVFDEIFFCRVDSAGRGNDACNWLEGGFQLAGGSLLACGMGGAVRKITDHVRAHFPALSQGHSSSTWTSSSSRSSSTPPSSKKRALLVLDGCKQQVFVGQVRVSLRELLRSLQEAFNSIGVTLTAAVTMREAGPTEPGRVGISGEKIEVVRALDARSTAELFGMCCSRKLNVVELNPKNEDDSYGAFSKSDIVLALRGHPGCVQDLCRCPLVHEERGLLLHRQTLLERVIPELQAQYLPLTAPTPPIRAQTEGSPPRREPRIPSESRQEALSWVWREASGGHTGPTMGFYDRGRGQGGGEGQGEVTWGRLCVAIGRFFERKVPGARGRPLESADFDLFASDAALWKQEDGGSPVSRARRKGARVSEVPLSREKLDTFWSWFWQAWDGPRRMKQGLLDFLDENDGRVDGCRCRGLGR